MQSNQRNNNHSTQNPLVSIIIVYFKTPYDTLELLASLQTLSYKPIEIILVDNSNDISFKRKISKEFPTIVFIQSETNLGFAGGNNLGINHAAGEYFFFLNSDTLVVEGTLEPMVELLDSHPEIGIVSPKVLYPDGKTIQYAGALSINPYTGRGKRIGLMELDSGQFDYCQPTELGHGAALMVPRRIVEKVGNWPTIYFLYYEEHDWVEQIKRSGYLIYYQGNSTVIHKEAKSTGGTHSPLKVYYMTRNRLLFMRRNSTGIQFVSGIVFYFIISIPKELLLYLLRGQFYLLGSFFSGLVWHFRHPTLKVS